MPGALNRNNAIRYDANSRPTGDLIPMDEIIQAVLSPTQDSLQVSGPGVAGTPSGGVTSVQGVATGTPLITTGNGYAASDSKTRPADTNAYAIGDVINDSASAGTIWTFANIGPAGGRVIIDGVWQRIDVNAIPAGMGAFRLHLFNAAPTVINDNAAFSIAVGDRAKYLGFIDIPAPELMGATLWAQDDSVRKQVTLVTTSLYGMLETRGAYTPNSGSVYTVHLRSLLVG